jgi:hypothetical protein
MGRCPMLMLMPFQGKTSLLFKLCYMKNIILTLSIIALPLSAQRTSFTPDEFWLDTDGNRIEGHACGILEYKGTYYWYGEDHHDGLEGGYIGTKSGMPCYSSKDLYNWKFEGYVMPAKNYPPHFLDTHMSSRAKVIYNAKTKKFVMWGHFDDMDHDSLCSAGIAIADKPTGPFKMVKVFRPVQYDYGKQNKQRKEDKLGNCYRDMNLYMDDDGTAYTIYSSEDNATMYVVRLSDDYLDVQRPVEIGKTWCRALPDRHQEAPAIFKYNKKYYMITSEQMGWDHCRASYFMADNMLGPWKYMGNPWTGTEVNLKVSYNTQSTFVLHAPGKKENCFIFMSDRWMDHKLIDSKHIWQPFMIRKDGTFDVKYFTKWDLSIFDINDDNTPLEAPAVTNKNSTLQWNAVKNATGYNILHNGQFIGVTQNTKYDLPKEIAGLAFTYTVQAMKLDGTTSPCSNGIVYSWDKPEESFLSDFPYISGTVGYHELQIDKPLYGMVFHIGDKSFTKGFGTHAPSEIVYYLNSRYSKLTSTIGLQYLASNGEKSSVTFRVYGDNKLLYESSLIKRETPAQNMEVNISGVNELKLVVTDGGDGQDYDWGNWCDVKIYK